MRAGYLLPLEASPDDSITSRCYPQNMARETRFSAWIQAASYFLMVGGMLAAVAAPIVLVIEVGEWATSSEWPGLTLADGLALFGIEHEIAETEDRRWTDMLLAFPLTLSLFVMGILTFLAGLNIGDWGIDRDLHADHLNGD